MQPRNTRNSQPSLQLHVCDSFVRSSPRLPERNEQKKRARRRAQSDSTLLARSHPPPVTINIATMPCAIKIYDAHSSSEKCILNQPNNKQRIRSSTFDECKPPTNKQSLAMSQFAVAFVFPPLCVHVYVLMFMFCASDRAMNGKIIYCIFVRRRVELS